MNPQLLLVLGLLCASIIAFVVNKPRMDVVALLIMIALPLFGIISLPEALAGFSDSSVILIAVLFVIGEGLVRTGIAYRLGDWLVAKAGGSETRLLVFLMLAVATLGSIMSSTGVVAIFIPVVLGVCQRLEIHPGRLMMPLSVAALISGMLTLVGTPPNLVVDGALQREGFKGLSFLSFTPIGAVVLVLAIGYIVAARNWLIRSDSEETKHKNRPRHKMVDLIQKYELAGREHRLRILPGSPFVAKTLGECPAFREHGTKVVAIERPGRFSTQLMNPQASIELAAGDILLIDTARPDQGNLKRPAEDLQLEPLPLQGIYFTDQSREVGMAEMIVPPDSSLIGKSLYQLDFRNRYGLTVAGLRQGQHTVKDKIAERHLRAGDTLLVIGPWKAIHNVQRELHDFVVLSLPQEADQTVPAASQAPYALGALLFMIVMMVAGIVPNVIAALISCIAMGLFGCVTMDSAYKSINWKVLILIVGMMPIATALQKTGGIDLAVKGLTGSGHSDPRILLVELFALTAGIGLFISNTVTAVLVAPIAISAANALGISPHPFAVTVALAASTAFMTPISSPVNTLVLGPGQYKFMDFVKIGVPLSILVMIVCLIMIPILFPFR